MTPHSRCSCQPLHHINRDLGSALRGGLPQHTLNDLGPGTLGTGILHQLRDREITALIAHESSIRALRSELIMVRPPCGAWLLASSHRQRNGQLIPTRHIPPGKSSDGPGQSMDG